LEATRARFKQRYHSSHLGAAIRFELFHCGKCRESRPRRLKAPLAPLHPSRLREGAAPFSECGMDHFGPTQLSGGAGKCWGLLFICLSTRAVHLEDCKSPGTSDALLALQRFVDRRGKPRTLRCDQGTAFRSAAKIIKKSSEDLCKEFGVGAARLLDLDFSFNPPYAPHWGGSWERIIGEVKNIVRMLRMSAGSVTSLTQPVFRTFLVHAESILNARPIATDGDGRPICPAQLLNPASQHNGGFPVCAAPAKVLRQVRQAVAHFWKRWRVYYLSSISLERLSGGRLLPLQLKPGDPVLVRDPGQLFQEHWKKATVLAAHQSSDGFVRSVDVVIDGKTLRHDIRNIGVVDAVVLSRVTSPTAPKIGDGGSVDAASASPMQSE
jgi:hypothetical protein